jgi:hypothetical protein
VAFKDLTPKQLSLEDNMNYSSFIYLKLNPILRFQNDKVESNSNLLNPLPLESFLKLLIQFSRLVYQQYIEEEIRDWSLKENVSESNIALLNTYRMFEDWPNRFYAFIDKSCELGDNYFGDFIRELDKFASVEYDFLLEPVKIHLEEKLNRGEVLPLSRKTTNKLASRMGLFLTNSKTADLLSINQNIVNKLMESNQLISVRVESNLRSYSYVSKDSVEKYKKIKANQISFPQAVRRLGINTRDLSSLIESGFIELAIDSYKNYC